MKIFNICNFIAQKNYDKIKTKVKLNKILTKMKRCFSIVRRYYRYSLSPLRCSMSWNALNPLTSVFLYFSYIQILFRPQFSGCDGMPWINRFWRSADWMGRAVERTAVGLECGLAWICNWVQVASKLSSTKGNQSPMKIFWS